MLRVVFERCKIVKGLIQEHFLETSQTSSCSGFQIKLCAKHLLHNLESLIENIKCGLFSLLLTSVPIQKEYLPLSLERILVFRLEGRRAEKAADESKSVSTLHSGQLVEQ